MHAGLSYKITRNVALDLSYRYANLGDAVSGDLVAYDGTNNFNNPMMFNHLTSHDLRLGLRVNLDSFGFAPSYSQPVYAPPQVYAPQQYQQQQPVYAPPQYQQQYQQPVYAPPPPVRSRG